jgi:hypothetical protein
MTDPAWHVAMIASHALYVAAAASMLYQLVRLRRVRWRLLRELRRRRIRRRQPSHGNGP